MSIELSSIMAKSAGSNFLYQQLLDPALQVAPDATIGKYLDNSGALITNSAFLVSAPMTVSAGDTLAIQYPYTEPTLKGCVFGDSGFICSLISVYSQGVYTIPASATYIRINAENPMTANSPLVFKLNSESTAARKICFVGDSITLGLNVSNPYCKVASERIKATFQNLGISGSEISSANALNPICNRLNTIQTTCDTVVIFAGINDYRNGVAIGATSSANTAEFYGALNKIGDTLSKYFPFHRKIFFTPLRQNYAGATPVATLAEYVTAIKTTCDKFGFECYDSSNESGLCLDITEQNKQLGQDGLHPNQTGHNFLARYVARKIV